MMMKDFIKALTGSDIDSGLLYGKDLACPEKWREAIMDELLPPIVTYRGPNDLSKVKWKEYPTSLYYDLTFLGNNSN
jgi:hypothetical protein